MGIACWIPKSTHTHTHTEYAQADPGFLELEAYNLGGGGFEEK